MLANIIYFTVFLILAFVLSIAVKAITRGVEAKQLIKEEKNPGSEIIDNDEIQNTQIVNELKELKDLHNKGIIDDKEFKKAKEKVLK